ncbi:MAG: VOC family protein [Deltaproteobacteria bacterium]|nr:VOC family protein [Deltaproteobacteria bacterium]
MLLNRLRQEPCPYSQTAHFILYVKDQTISTEFYTRVLGCVPRLDVPGMTEFALSGGAVLGLMPVSGIKRLLGDKLPNPEAVRGVPCAELYLVVDNATVFHQRTLAAGGRELSPVTTRDWGHVAGYCLDPDGHVVAFANALEKKVGKNT